MTTSKPLDPARAAPAIEAISRLWELSRQQANTAAKMAAEIACQRLRSLCPPQEEANIRRLREAIIEGASAGTSPVDIVRKAAEKGQIDFRWMPGQERPSAALRAACRLVLTEIEGAALGAPLAIEQALAQLPAQDPLPPAELPRPKAARP